MARPEKCKRICTLPEKSRFVCVDNEDTSGTQIVSVEEFETIRLIDYLGLTQEQCSSQMHVARTTVQRLYTDARKKIANYLIAGTSLEISGGNYQLCENSSTCCKLTYCPEKSSGCNCEFRLDGCILNVSVNADDRKRLR